MVLSPSDEVWLATIDVTALYTSIPHQAGLEAVEWALLNSEGVAASKVFLMELLHFCLYHGYFQSEDEFFLQIAGTSMGFSGAPSYANLFMSKFENDFVFSNALWLKGLRTYLRFIDDIFVIWTGAQQDLILAIADLDSRHESIRFTHSISNTSLAYLDVLVTRVDTGFSTSLQ